jgi:chitodextrinase
MASARTAVLAALASISALVLAGSANALRLGAEAVGTGPVAAYSFNSVSGASAPDDSGNGNTGAVSGAVPATGRNGGGLAFDGIDDVVTVADSASLDLTSAVTLEAWIDVDIATDWRAVLYKGKPGALAYGFFSSSSANIPTGVVLSGGAEHGVSGGQQFQPGSWAHMALTYDGSMVRLYLGGQLFGSTAASGPLATNADPFRIGGNGILGQHFAGVIDDVRVYNRALTAAEIQVDMTTPVSGSPPPPPPPPPPPASTPVAAYSFDYSGATVADDSGHGNTGAVSGALPATGRNGGGLAFDGIDDVVTVADSASLDLTAAVTVEAWINLDVPSVDWRAVLYKGKPGALAYGFFSSSGVGSATPGTPTGVVLAGGAERGVSGGQQFQAGGWAHMALTYDGSMVRLYLGGQLFGSTAASGPLATNTDPLRIGGNGVVGQHFSGVIDDVRVYNRVLVAAEIQADMDTPVDGGSPPPPPPPDTQAPTAPSGFSTSGATQNSISLRWNASSDNVGVAGYTVYKGATAAGSTASLSYTLTGLTCGTSYALAVDAYDAASNRSAKALLTASTSACSTVDTQAPSAPSGLRTTSTAQNAITLAWNASTDNVGVAGYGVYKNGTSSGSTASTSFTFSGLACGTSYTLAVDAYDAAGNRSLVTPASFATAACPPPGAADWYLSPSGSDSNSCTQTAPCRSVSRAYAVSAPGDVVQLAGGSYGSQSVSGTKSAPAVIMQPASGATVTFGSLDVDADRIEIRDVHLNGGLTVGGNSDFATLRNIDMNGQLYITGPRDLSIIGGDVGPFIDNPSWLTHDNGSAPQRVLIQGVWFHDFTVSDASVHTECILVIAGNGITFRGNKFTNCSIFDISLGWCCSSPGSPTNVLIENNFFGPAMSGAQTTLHFNTNLSPVNYTIRNNSSATPWVLDQGQGTFSNVRAMGNAVAGGGCGRVVWTYNVFSGSGCGGTGNKTVGSLGFANPNAGDFHVGMSSPVINSGAPTDFAATDYDGQVRPLGSAPDAGADESG